MCYFFGSLDYCPNIAIIVDSFKNYVRKYRKIDIADRLKERRG